MFQIIRKNQNKLTILTSCRLVHRNHPGHKKVPMAVIPKIELPDRYLSEANYPPVKPKLPPGAWSNEVDTKLAWKYFDEGQKFHSLKTIQERLSVLAYLNIQQTLSDLKVRGTRWTPIYITSSLSKTPRMLPFNQYITKTDIKVVKDLTSIVEQKEDVILNQSVDSNLYEKIKNHVKENILLYFNKEKELSETHEIPKHPDTYKAEVIEREKDDNRKFKEANETIKIIMDSCISILSAQDTNKHLLNAQYGTDVSIKGYWKRCGFENRTTKGIDFKDKDVIGFQYDDVASYQIKCDMPLPPVYKFENESCHHLSTDSEKIEPLFVSTKQAYSPSVYKIFSDHVLPMQVPGHWYGDHREFNFLTVLNTVKPINYFRSKFEDYEEDFDLVKSMVITTGLAELTAQAYYLGFSMWKDLTYPLTGQYILTNGQDFSFAKYQLNTLNLWNKAVTKKNLCFLTVPKRLWKLNEDRTEIIDFNDDIFKKLINTLTNKPIKNDTEICENYSELDYMIGGTRLRPYLSIQNIEEQLTNRHKLLATSLYELVKYDRPTNYLNLRNNTLPDGDKPKFANKYDKITHDYRDIVLDYYPRDYYGFKLIERIFLRKYPKQTEKFWDLKTPVYEWANVPPPDTNNIPRVIDLTKF